MDLLGNIHELRYEDNGVDHLSDTVLRGEIMMDIDRLNESIADGEKISSTDEELCWTDICYAWTYRHEVFSQDEWKYIIKTLKGQCT